MKFPIFLLVLLFSLDVTHHALGRNRRSRVSNFWRTQLSRNQNSGSEQSSNQLESQTESSSSPSGTQTPQAPSRPTGSDCKEAGFFPTPGSCLHFFRCVDWNGDGSFYSAFHFTCPVGTVFDDTLDVCNYPHAARRQECYSGAQGSPSFASSTTLSTTTTSTTTTTTSTLPSTSQQGSSQTISSDSFIFTCDSQNRYRRHPRFCNQYYYCVNDEEQNLRIFTCPLDLVFDELNQICAKGEGDLVKNCNLIPYSTPKPVPTTTSTSTAPPTEPIETTLTWVTDSSLDISTQKTWEVAPNSLFDCPAPGYFPFEGDCIRFYKCVETDLSQLKGLLYKCPDGFGYSETSQRCLREKELPPCHRIPQETHLRVVETATPLYPDDLVWFFNN